MKESDNREDLELQITSLTKTLAKVEAELEYTQSSQQVNEQKLKEASSLIETIIAHSPIPMAVASVDGKLMAMNKICLAQLGDPDVEVGMPLSKMKNFWKHFDIDGNPIPLDKLPLLQALKGNVTHNKEICVIRQDGTKRWQIASSNPVYDHAGNVTAAFVAFPDITDRKIAESKLAESENKYRNIFNNANISLWDEDFFDLKLAVEEIRKEGITDLREHLIEFPDLVWELTSKVKINNVNKATLALFKVDSRENFFEHIVEFFGENAINIFKEGLYAIWDNKSYFRAKANYLNFEGDEIKGIISYALPKRIEDYKNIPVSILDVTQLDYQQDRLSSVIDALPDITFIFDEDGRYLEILTSRHDLLYDDLMSLKGQLIHDQIPKVQADLYLRTINKALSTKEKQIIEYELDVPQGKVWFEGRVTPMNNTFKNKNAVVWLAVDITEHKKLEEQLRQAQKMEAVGILTGGIAHEFNNLLSPILGYTELLLNDKSRDNVDYNGLNQIFIASNRAKLLVQQLLAYGRQSMSQREPVELAFILSDAMKLIKNTLPSNIAITKDIAPNLPTINGMPNEIHQIIINLCVNASHAMPDGGELSFTLDVKAPVKHIQNQLPADDTQYICLSVKDTGTGMDSHTLERMFDPFFTTKGVGQGSGLGLSVVEGILEQHNGVIEVESSLGKGSTFKVYFPVSDIEIKVVEKIKTSVVQGSEHILLVDDEPIVLDLAKNMLEMLNYKTSAYTDCDEALEVFIDNPDKFDLIIVDYGMPTMNGKEFSKQAKRVQPDISIILCTGYGDLIAQENIAQWGMDDILFKPFAIKDISGMVRTVLSQKKN